jgi:hypothetical protein
MDNRRSRGRYIAAVEGTVEGVDGEESNDGLRGVDRDHRKAWIENEQPRRRR